MKFPKPVKNIETLWNDYLQYIVNPPVENSNEYKRQKVIFFSAMVMFINYLKVRFPIMPKNPTKAQRDKAQAELQEIYDGAEQVLKQMSEDKVGTDLGGT